jgi:hypothetical protein
MSGPLSPEISRRSVTPPPSIGIRDVAANVVNMARCHRECVVVPRLGARNGSDVESMELYPLLRERVEKVGGQTNRHLSLGVDDGGRGSY